jgi:hypothetical protein
MDEQSLDELSFLTDVVVRAPGAEEHTFDGRQHKYIHAAFVHRRKGKIRTLHLPNVCYVPW